MPWYEGLELGTPAFDIAQSAERRIRVLAGPGAGKSFAMKRRVARLLEEEGVLPTRMLPVTFTRVAAEDLHRELLSLAVVGANQLEARTLHSLAMSILMRAHVIQALHRTPRPLNEFELQPLLEDLSPTFGNKYARKRKIDAYLAAWSRLQNQQPGVATNQEDQDFSDALTAWLRLHEAMLIGEAIPMLFNYLTLNPGAPEHTEFTHILVDEYQDLNRAEQEVIEMLGSGGEICIIGDDDQSIYSFKHAHPAGIREWGANCGAQDHEILECRRCPTTIVHMANSLIARNRDREPGAMVPLETNGPGVVKIRQFPTVEAEAAAVADDIERLITQGVAPGDIIVLSQRKTFASPIYTLLRQRGIPAKSYYAEMPLDTKEAQERFAILKLFLKNEDRVALRWLLGCHHNRWHSSQYARISAHVTANNVTPFQTLVALENGTISIPNTGTLVDRFREIGRELASLTEALDLDDFTTIWLPPSEQTALLAQAVAEHLEAIDSIPALFDALQQEFTQPEIPLEVAEVRLMSFHKSKGLSSPNVYITGCVQGLVPSQPSPGTPPAEAAAKLEEDRRLFYVAMTRVKANPAGGQPGYLHVTYPQTMSRADAMRNNISAAQMRGQIAYLHASRFIGELGESAPAPQKG